MSAILLQCVILVVSSLQFSDGDIYQDRAKIRTYDGHLELKPAFDKNIYLRPNGPKSKIFVGNVNIQQIYGKTQVGQYTPSNSEDLDQHLNGPEGILARLENLEKGNAFNFDEMLTNVSKVWNKVNNVNRKLINLQRQVTQLLLDQCQSQLCEHGGTCLGVVGGYHCLCPTNWEGTNCDIDVNECRNFAGSDLGCQNGAECINRPGSYECLCKSGWFGVHCTRKAKDCSEGNFEMCGHGTCVPVTTGEGITCICDQGWTKNDTSGLCLTDINECEAGQGSRCSTNPKVECINLPGSFRCGQCPVGYQGDGYTCSDINECTTLPNGGCSPVVTCHNTMGSRICGPCSSGYQGDGITCVWKGSCNIDHGGCHPSAQCIDNGRLGGTGSQCICPEGMEGDGYGLQGCFISGNLNESCASEPCGVHGICHTLRTGYTCICHKGFSGSHCEMTTNLCANKPCLNGGICREDKRDPQGFRCECTALYSGSRCQLMSKRCGGVLDNKEGVIAYPIANTTYNNNARCAWLIHTQPDKVINITFTKFYLEPHPDCMYDFLQIHDGRSSASQLLGRFCGDQFPMGGNIISSHNNLYLWLSSDTTVAKNGFTLHWSSVTPVCGGEVDVTKHGQISSPGAPGKYPPNRDCYWHLSTTLGKRIQLMFFNLDIEKHPDCSFDYLAIYDGIPSYDGDSLIKKYCNTTQPEPLISPSSDLLVHFHSDSYSNGYGFQIAYMPVEGVPGCGGYHSQDRGEIRSPSLDGTYLNNLLCEYKIQTSLDTVIRIDFKSFNLQRSVRCKSDYLKIYDGASSDSRLIGRFCGSTFPKSYTSSTNSLFFIFKSDRTVGASGFLITYESKCQFAITGDSGIIKSPGYPFNYPSNRICEYVISTSPGKVIQLSFQDFDIEDNRHYNCQYDNLEIRDGPNENSSILGKFCGGSDHTPPMQISKHNYLYLKFTSYLSVSGTGFYANYTTINTECGGIYTSTTGLINHPSEIKDKYKNNQICSWVLIAPEGMHIIITWNRFSLKFMSQCKSDYLKLIEINENGTKTNLGKFCGPNPPPAITTTTNKLMIEFESDKTIRSAGFSLSYTFLDEKTHCGGNYINPHGVIYSPNWPKSYEPNRDCTWIIQVPVGQQVKLNISQFDLEKPTGHKCTLGDYLELRNGATDNSPLIDQLCGRFEKRIITSMNNVLYIRFHSDFYLTGKGFVIEWDGTVTGCGGTMTNSEGSIASPNYPNNYNNLAECFYKIVINSGSRIHLSFVELELERTHKCADDYVEIYDGLDHNANKLGRYCSMSPDLSNIITSSNSVFIKFRSDFYLNGKGFLLNYKASCHTNITGRYGVIETPNFPDTYPSNSDCLWNITVPKGNKINATFTHFNLYKTNRFRPFFNRNHQSAQSCNKDYIQIKDSVNSHFSDKICGNTLPQMITTKENTLQIRFSSRYVARTGFRLEWVSFGCGGILRPSRGVLEFSKHFDLTQEMECEWILKTSFGKSLALNFSEIHLSETKDCAEDAIEVYNGDDTSSPLLTKLCSQKSTSIQSTANVMLVRLVKHSSLRDFYFKSRYYSTATTCGGSLQTDSGFIYSKNYPKNYDNNLDCLWKIVVSNNHRIELNFTDFDLYSQNRPHNDCNDKIEVYETNPTTDTNSYKLQICPRSDTKYFLSETNTIYIKFVTNNVGTAKGFKGSFRTVCGSTVTAVTDGTLSSDKYPHLKRCTWTIKASDLDKKISLSLTHMSLPSDYSIVLNRTCSSTYLHLYDGDNTDAPLIGEYCGRKIPQPIVTRGSALTIELATYSDKITGKFSAYYSTLSNACGGIFTSEEGEIASPNYPRPYPADVDCEWTLDTSPGNQVYIIFDSFSLESSESCNEDYLEIRHNSSGGQLHDVYCGSDVPSNITIANKVYIKFRSRSQTNMKNNGFLIHYGLNHNNEITGETGKVTSPLYPNSYHGSGQYSWRILTPGARTISININSLDIQNYGGMCINKLAIYDGYDDSAHILKELCGVLPEFDTVETSSNAVFIKLFMDDSNTGSLFSLTWTSADKIDTSKNNKERINCGLNERKTLKPGETEIIKSPNYPSPYNLSLHCRWEFKSTPGNHLKISFTDFDIEETNDCFADSISIYSADKIHEWKPIKEKQCLSDSLKGDINATNYLKVDFVSDETVTKKGFLAKVESVCGGTLTDLSGTFGPINAYTINKDLQKCDWHVKVRPGRVIKLSFEHFNITSNDCSTSVILHNGESIDSPMLGSGKYCGLEHEIKHDLVTSSNSLYVTYVTRILWGILSIQYDFKIRYEEQSEECGFTTELDEDRTWEIINSPNFPAVPQPYTECTWSMTGPVGEILRVDFIDRFDLDNVNNCETEAVEIYDGTSAYAPMLGRYCQESPGTVKTNSNAVFIKYFTQLPEPRNGFKANISVDVCGGTIKASTGEILSPGYPRWQSLPYGTVCKWEIIGIPLDTLLITPQDIHLPGSERPCGTYLTVEETIADSNNTTILRKFCMDVMENDLSSIKSNTNKVLIRLNIEKPIQWVQILDYRGFRFTFNTSSPKCGGILTVPEGFITTPGYPMETSLEYCHWKIEVPKNRRVRIEILDADTEKCMIFILNGGQLLSVIATLPDQETKTTSRIFESTGNKLIFYTVLTSLNIPYRVKAKFSSSEASLCGGELQGLNGYVMSPNMNRSYVCEWHYNLVGMHLNDTFKFSTVLLTVNMTSSDPRAQCKYFDAKIMVTFKNLDNYEVNKSFCGTSIASYKIPTPTFDLKAVKDNTKSLYFNIAWELQPCGGIVHVTESPINIIDVPVAFNSNLECAWQLSIEANNRIQINLEGMFSLECDDEYITISRYLTENSQYIGKYCKSNTPKTPILINFNGIYVQYHSKAKMNTDIRLIAKTVTNQCGGVVFDYDRTFASPNYPKSYQANQECIWEITANIGNRVDLKFVDRFTIEETPNCTKDAVIIYDWKNDEYQEIAKLCGRNPPPSYTSTFYKMKVVFRTDSDINLDGFKAQWNPTCGGTYSATEKKQFLYSPNYPEEYSNLLNCTYEISSPNDKIEIEFLDFELENDYPQCSYDNLTLSYTENINFFENNYYIFGLYCGTHKPPQIISNKIILKLMTDENLTKKGFQISFKTYSCGGHVNSTTLIKSSNFERYYENMNCTWFINAPKDDIVVINFFYIDLEDNFNCQNDFISIYNGPTVEDDKRIALLCGYINKTTILKSTGDAMVVEFITDSIIQFTGFKARVSFSLSERVGCGGNIDMTDGKVRTIKSPLVGNSTVYENYLDCDWAIQSADDTYIKIEFLSFHISPCNEVNQTALGYSKCDCDYVQIKNGLFSNSLLIGTYCGNVIPNPLISSGNQMSIKLSTDGEIPSTGFEIKLTTLPTVCGQSHFDVDKTNKEIKSPGYDGGSIPTGTHCSYLLDVGGNWYTTVRLSISTDLRPASEESKLCTKDKLVITTYNNNGNITHGKDFVMHTETNDLLSRSLLYELTIPTKLELCGYHESYDIYVTGSVSINLITSPVSDSSVHRGVKINFSYSGYCSRNYTGSQGRIKLTDENENNDDCYTLITAPENHTISLFFFSIVPVYWDEESYLSIFDGNTTSSPNLVTVKLSYSPNLPVFSSGRYILLYDHQSNMIPETYDRLTYDSNFVTTDKGQGCGGKLTNDIGKITSPLYPEIYRRRATCEWELETPSSTKLMLRFVEFDMGVNCDENYVQLVDSKGIVLSTYCSEAPADYTSQDNYVKVVMTSTVNNGGTGWIAVFAGI